MKKLRSVTIILMCLMVLLSVASCNTTTTPDDTQKATESVKNTEAPEDTAEVTAETDEESSDDWFAGKDFSEKMTINLASVQIDESKDYTNGDDFVKWWADTFNVEFDIIPLTWGNWSERLRVWINSDDMPEWCVWNYVHGEAINYAEQGLVKMLPEGWEEQYPNLAKAQNDSPMSVMAQENFGGTYFLFRPIYSNNRPADKIGSHMSLTVRKDWAEAIGYDIGDAMKISDVMEYARLVKEADPGNVGENFAPIVSRTGNIALFVQFNNSYSGVNNLPYYKAEDGKYKWGPADDSTLEALKILSEAYNEGLIAQDFYTIQDPDDFGAFYTTGDSAACIMDGMAFRMKEVDQHMTSDLGVKFEDAVEAVVVLGEDGYYHGYPIKNYWGTNIFSPHIEDEKLDRIMQIFDYSCTDEGQLKIRCGIEGVDWDMGEDGNVISYLSEEESLWDKYAMLPLYVNMMVLSDDFQFFDPNYKESIRDRVKQLHVIRQDNSTEQTFPSEPDWTVELHESQALNLASMNYGDEYAALIVKPGDIEANWKAWVEEKMPLIQPVLDELNGK